MKFSEIAFKCLFAHRANFLWVNLAADFQRKHGRLNLPQGKILIVAVIFYEL